jgi:hypothetical protein
MYFCRAGEATTMPLHDPELPSPKSDHCDAAGASALREI